MYILSDNSRATRQLSMPIHYQPDYDGHIAYITGRGRVTFADCEALIAKQRKDVPHRLHELNDFRNVELAIQPAQVVSLAQLNQELYADIDNIRFAVVVDSGLAYGMARMFDVYLNNTVEFKIFEDYDAALAWVHEAASLDNVTA